MRKTPVTILAAVALTGALLTACGNTPGSVAGDPLAVKLVDGEKKMEQWDAVGLTMMFDGDGALSSTTLPCIDLTSTTHPTESFSMRWVKTPTSSDTCTGPDDATVRIDYADSTLYVTDPTVDVDNDCEVAVTSHRVSGDLAEKFVQQQTNQTKMADLMKTATKISGDDRQISVAIDTEAMLKLGKSSIPSGVDPDDIDVTADATLDENGALAGLVMKISAGDQGGLTIDTRYHQASQQPSAPDKKCVTQGSPASSTADITGYLT